MKPISKYKIALVFDTPLIGDQQRQFDTVLNQLGRKPTEFLTTSVIPSNNFGVYYEDKGHKKPTPSLLSAWGELHQILGDHNPNVVVTLGAEALKALTHYQGIEKYRGSVLEGRAGFKVIPTYHPSLLVRGGRTSKGLPVRAVMLWDLKKAIRESQTLEVTYMNRWRITDPRPKEAEEYLKHIIKTKRRITIDIETEKGQISCIGIAPSPTTSICLHGGTLQFVNGLVHQILKDPEIPLVFQNGAYDLAWLERDFCQVNGFEFDTLVAMNTCFPELPQSLAFQTSIFSDIPYYKDDLKDHKRVRDWEKFWTYNCNDVLTTYDSYLRLRDEIAFRDLHKMFKFRMSTYKEMYQISKRGIRFDHEKRTIMRRESKKRIRAMEVEFSKLLDRQVKDKFNKKGEGFNLSSDKQLKELVYGEWGIKPQINRQTKRSTLDENALKKLAVKYPKRLFFTNMITYRKEETLYEKYLNVKIDEDKRIRCMYGLAETGRLRSSGSPFWTGANLQNIPKSMRVLFLPDMGHVFVEVDLSQAEARVVAYESGDSNLINLFESGGDIHRANASNIFGIPQNAVSSRERQLGKKVAHATNYGMGPRTMCEAIIKELGTEYAIKESEAKRFQQNYHSVYPGVAQWHKQIQQQLATDRTLRNCFGSERYFLGPLDDKTFKEAYAWVPQGTVADLINQSIQDWKMMSLEWPILLQVHDSALILAAEGDLERFDLVQHLTTIFEVPITINEQQVTIPIDIKVGKKNWGSMHEIN